MHPAACTYAQGQSINHGAGSSWVVSSAQLSSAVRAARPPIPRVQKRKKEEEKEEEEEDTVVVIVQQRRIGDVLPVLAVELRLINKRTAATRNKSSCCPPQSTTDSSSSTNFSFSFSVLCASFARPDRAAPSRPRRK